MKNSNQMELNLSTSSQEDTRANPSASLDLKKALKIRDTSGQSILDLSKNVGQLGLLEKTLVDTLNSVSTPLSRTWKVKITQSEHLVFQLLASAHRTKGKESGLWRTPDAAAGGSNLPGIQKALDEGHLKRPSGQQIQIRLQDQVKEPRLWPTPRASKANVGENIQHTSTRNGQGQTGRESSSEEPNRNWWNIEPDVGRVADGVPDRTHRLKALGNAVVPQTPYYIAKSILEVMDA